MKRNKSRCSKVSDCFCHVFTMYIVDCMIHWKCPGSSHPVVWLFSWMLSSPLEENFLPALQETEVAEFMCHPNGDAAVCCQTSDDLWGVLHHFSTSTGCYALSLGRPIVKKSQMLCSLERRWLRGTIVCLSKQLAMKKMRFSFLKFWTLQVQVQVELEILSDLDVNPVLFIWALSRYCLLISVSPTII